MFISAFVATICLVLIVAAVFSYTVVEQGYAYWGAPESSSTPSEAADVVAPTEDGYHFSEDYYFNPSAKYFTYQVMDGTTVVSTHSAIDGDAVTLLEDGTLSFTSTATITDTMTVEVIGYNGNLSDIEIPSSITVGDVELSVTSVSGINSSTTVALTSIAIPETVTNIGANCFSGYRTTLKEIRFETKTTGTYTLAAQAFRFAKGSSTTVYYGADAIASKTALEATNAFVLGSGAFLGWS